MTAALESRLAHRLWPHVATVLGRLDVAGVAVGVVQGDEVASWAYGARDVRTGEPVTAETMFSLASVSKPFVAIAVMTLASRGELDLDAPVTDLVPEFSLADGRASEITARGLLAHTSGLGDVDDYDWHDPQLGDDALSVLASSVGDRRLEHEPGTFHYSNLGYELLGLAVSRVTGTTFEDAMTRLVLAPAGMERSTFLRADVPRELAASPHVGMPLVVPGDSYPYTRRHAPSSTLHSNVEEMCRWMQGLLNPPDPELVRRMWEPVVAVDDPPWEESQSLGWGIGTWRGHRLATHSGMDPGFRSLFVVVPEQRLGVVVLGNSNTVPAYRTVAAALEVAADGAPGEAVEELLTTLRTHAGPVAAVLADAGPEAAAAEYHRLATADPPEIDVEWEGLEDSVWGAIELHRTELVWPLMRLWAELRPDSSTTWTMTGWAHRVDGERDLARQHLEKALALDPDNEDAAQILTGVDR